MSYRPRTAQLIDGIQGDLTVRVVSIGEPLIELWREADDRFSLGFGGDTFITALCLARHGAKAAYATALGADPYSEAILSLAQAEGLATDLILRVGDRPPGLCIADSDGRNGRRRLYWREHSPARQLFELPGWDRIAEQIVAADFIYLSGITLSLYSNVGLGRLLAALEFGRERGAKIVFDGNWRPHAWRGEEQRARAVYAEALKRSDIALPAFQDEASLWGDASPEATVNRVTTFGVREIVVKHGHNDVLVHVDGKNRRIAVPQRLDQSGGGAGDAFNGAFLAARISGKDHHEAVIAGHQQAAETIRRGGFAPSSAGPHDR